MSIYFNNHNLQNHVIKIYNDTNAINLSDLYEYLNKNLITKYRKLDNGKQKVIYNEIYNILVLIKNNFHKDNKIIDIYYNNDFQFLYFDPNLLYNYLQYFKFNGNFIINGFSNKSLRINKLKINGYLKILNHSIQSLSIKNSEIVEGISINDVSQSIQLENNKFNKVEIDGNNTKELILSWNKDFNQDIGEVTLNNFTVIENFLLFTNNRNIFNKLSLSNCRFIKNQNQFHIADLEVKELKISELFNSSESMTFSRIKILNKLAIKNSNLGKTVFNGVEIGKLEIENATLNDCIFNGVDFCNNYQLSDNNGEIPTKVLKDNYRQLKHVMDKNGNHTEANEFYSKEMYYYLKELNNNSDKFNYKNSLKMLFDTKSNITGKYGERLILVFGYFINKFGTDIIFNIFLISYYLIFIYSLSFISNYLYPDNPIVSQLGGIILVLIIITGFILIDNIDINNKFKKVKKIKKTQVNIGYIIFIMIIGVISVISIIHEIKYDELKHSKMHFDGIKTFIYLLNPFSGLTDNSMLKLYWTEQLGMIIHKIIYGILIYQLIIALKRTTKR